MLGQCGQSVDFRGFTIAVSYSTAVDTLTDLLGMISDHGNVLRGCKILIASLSYVSSPAYHMGGKDQHEAENRHSSSIRDRVHNHCCSHCKGRGNHGD